MASVACSGIQSIACVRFDPPYIHDLVVGHNKTVKMSVDLDTNGHEFANLSSKNEFAIVLKLDVYFDFLNKYIL